MSLSPIPEADEFLPAFQRQELVHLPSELRVSVIELLRTFHECAIAMDKLDIYYDAAINNAVLHWGRAGVYSNIYVYDSPMYSVETAYYANGRLTTTLQYFDKHGLAVNEIADAIRYCVED